MTDFIFNISPFLLFLIGLVLGYIIKLAIPEHIFHKNTNKNSEVFDTYYEKLKNKGVKELTAREYQHLSMMKKIEFEKKYPQKADSKISMPMSKVFTIHSVLPTVYDGRTMSNKAVKILAFLSIILVAAGILLINLK